VGRQAEASSASALSSGVWNSLTLPVRTWVAAMKRRSRHWLRMRSKSKRASTTSRSGLRSKGLSW
jgi:hypothetical protein